MLHRKSLEFGKSLECCGTNGRFGLWNEHHAKANDELWGLQASLHAELKLSGTSARLVPSQTIWERSLGTTGSWRLDRCRELKNFRKAQDQKDFQPQTRM